jgi:hypothetical protein
MTRLVNTLVPWHIIQTPKKEKKKKKKKECKRCAKEKL